MGTWDTGRWKALWVESRGFLSFFFSKARTSIQINDSDSTSSSKSISCCLDQIWFISPGFTLSITSQYIWCYCSKSETKNWIALSRSKCIYFSYYKILRCVLRCCYFLLESSWIWFFASVLFSVMQKAGNYADQSGDLYRGLLILYVGYYWIHHFKRRK